MTRSGWRGPCLGLLIIVSGVVTQADYKESYRRAMQAYNRRNWTEAAALFRAAIAEQAADTGERINISGMDFKPYLPQFYLGVVLKNTNNCLGALDTWQRTNRQAVARAGEAATFARLSRECETLVAKATPAGPGVAPGPAPASTPANGPVTLDPPSISLSANTAALAHARENLERALRLERMVSVLEAEVRLLSLPAWQEPELGPALAIARRSLEIAQTQLSSVSETTATAPIEEAGALAGNAAAEFEAIQRHATARRDALRQQATSRAAPNSLPSVSSAKATASSSRGERSADAPTSSGQPLGLGHPTTELVKGAQLFFSGNYAGARSALAAARPAPGAAAAQGHLLLAATVYSLYLLGGEEDRALLNQAIAEVRLARQSDRKLSPDRNVFSPRFVEWFGATR